MRCKAYSDGLYLKELVILGAGWAGGRGVQAKEKCATLTRTVYRGM